MTTPVTRRTTPPPSRRSIPWPPRSSLLLTGEHGDPHHVLGLHPEKDGTVIRAYRPDAESMVVVLPDGQRVDMHQRYAAGLFQARVPAQGVDSYRLEVRYPDGATFTLDDPYRFWPTLGELDLHLLGEGRHEALWCNMGARVRTHQEVRGTSFAVWAPNARGARVVGDFNSWDGRLHPMRRLGSSGIWELFLPDVEPGARYKFEIVDANSALRLKADPYAFATEVPPGTASVVFESHHTWGDNEWLDRRKRTNHLEAPMSIYECHLGSWKTVPEEGEPLADLPGAGRAAARLPGRPRLHPRRVHARGRAPLRRLLGLPGVGLLRPHRPLRHARRLPPPGRPAPPGRHRRDRRLGAGPLPQGRLRPGPLRRHRPVRARGSPPGRAPGLGHAGVQLRPQRGAQLPAGQRPVLGGRVPRRRAAGRRRGLDALPRLLPRGRRVDPQRVRRAGEPGGGRVPEGVQHRRPRPPPRRPHHRRGVHGLADGVPARPMWAGSGSPSSGTWAGCTTPSTTSSGSRSTAATTTTSSPSGCSTPSPRTSSCRCPTTRWSTARARCWTRCRATAGSSWPTCGPCWRGCGPIRARSSSSWGRRSPRTGSGATTDRSTGTSSSTPATGAWTPCCAPSTCSTRSAPPCGSGTSTPTGFRWIDANDTDQNVLSFLRFPADLEHGRPLACIANLSPVVRQGYRVGLPRGGTWQEALNTDAPVFWGSGVVNGPILAEARPFHGLDYSATLTLPPLGVIWLEPEE